MITSCIILFRLASNALAGDGVARSGRIGSLVADAVLVIDDTAVPKKGTHSVGVAAQICFSAGQDRQLSDSGVTDAARGEVPVMVALRLFRELAQRDERPAESPICCCPWSASPTDLRSGYGIRVSSIFQGTKPGSSASTARRARSKYYLANLPAGMDLRSWPRRSRHDGFASRPINSWSRNSVSTTSREGLGTAFIVMR